MSRQVWVYMARVLLLAVIPASGIGAQGLCWEPWLGIRPVGGSVVAWGAHHLVRIDERSEPRTLTAPGVVCGVAGGHGEDLWAVFADGRWRCWSGEGWAGSWQVADTTAALAVSGDGRGGLAWQAVPGRIHRVRVAGQPRLEYSLELPGPAAGELRLDEEGGLWARQQWVVFRERGGRMVEAGRLPADTETWGVSAGALWAHRADGTLWTRGAGHPPILAPIRQAWPLPGGLLLRTGFDELWRLDHGLLQRLADLPELLAHPPADSLRLVPGPGGWLALETTDTRSLRQLDEGPWHERARLDRPPALVDRWIAGGRQWRLCADGRLLLDHNGLTRTLGRITDPLGLYPAGAGPLALGRWELAAWDWQGELLDRLPLAGARGAGAREDHLVIGLEQHLLVLETIEAEPVIAAELSLRITGDLLLGARWGVIRQGQRLELLDLDPPWQPRSVDLGLAPRADGEGLVLEDRLLLASPERLEVLELGEAGIRELDAPCVRYPVAHFCRRGPDRLLTLDHTGVLRQLRLVDNLPVSVDWEGELPLVGRMRIQGDSLRVLGEGAALDWPLPPATRFTPERLQGTPRLEPALARSAGSRWCIHRPAGMEGPLQAELVDLRGARRGLWTLAGRQDELSIESRGLARGVYFLVLGDSRGRTRVVPLNTRTLE